VSSCDSKRPESPSFPRQAARWCSDGSSPRRISGPTAGSTASPSPSTSARQSVTCASNRRWVAVRRALHVWNGRTARLVAPARLHSLNSAPSRLARASESWGLISGYCFMHPISNVQPIQRLWDSGSRCKRSFEYGSVLSLCWSVLSLVTMCCHCVMACCHRVIVCCHCVVHETRTCFRGPKIAITKSEPLSATASDRTRGRFSWIVTGGTFTWWNSTQPLRATRSSSTCSTSLAASELFRPW